MLLRAPPLARAPAMGLCGRYQAGAAARWPRRTVDTARAAQAVEADGSAGAGAGRRGRRGRVALMLLTRFRRRRKRWPLGGSGSGATDRAGGGSVGKDAEPQPKAAGSRGQRMAKAAAVTIAAGTAAGAAGLVAAIPALAPLVLRTGGGAAVSYAQKVLAKRGQSRTRATTGAFLLDIAGLWTAAGGRTVLEGMLAPEAADLDHLAVVEFQSLEAAETFLASPALQELRAELEAELEALRFEPLRRGVASAVAAAAAAWGLGRFRRPDSGDALVPQHSAVRTELALLAEQLARPAGGSGGAIATAHIFTATRAGRGAELGDDTLVGRPPGSDTVCQHCQDLGWALRRAGGIVRYEATNEQSATGLVVARWRSPAKLLQYLRSSAAGLTAAMPERLLLCPTPL